MPRRVSPANAKLAKEYVLAVRCATTGLAGFFGGKKLSVRQAANAFPYVNKSSLGRYLSLDAFSHFGKESASVPLSQMSRARPARAVKCSWTS